jgi:hypothetical protein
MPENSSSHPVPAETPNAVLTDSRPTSGHRDDTEALELHQIQTREDDELDYSDPSASSGDEYRVTTIHRTTSRASTERRDAGKDPWSRISRFWCRHVILTVPQKSNRDHFGKYLFNVNCGVRLENSLASIMRLIQGWDAPRSATFRCPCNDLQNSRHG